MIEPLLFLLLGLVGMWWGSDLIVSGARHLAERLRISEAVIGMTVVALGTSLPEIATNILAAMHVLAGEPASGLAIGNVLGSNIANLTIVLGLAALFSKTTSISQISLFREGTMTAMALGIFFLISYDLVITPAEGIIISVMYLFYVLFLILQGPVLAPRKRGHDGRRIALDFVMLSLGSGILWVGSEWVVTNGILLAKIFALKESIIGIGVGLGTSLPELTVSIIAIYRKAGELSIGNLLGSNIANPLIVLGIGAAISGFEVGRFSLLVLFPFTLFATLLALVMLFAHRELNRLHSAALIGFYLFFIYMITAIL
ncbi:MAG TPA: sodium:calcium antiporter [Candidatus Nanoarchaeia archaeon]|nr:sodium:calcium antiporter [Candidatus Nanoarchaeia archaeon]